MRRGTYTQLPHLPQNPLHNPLKPLPFFRSAHSLKRLLHLKQLRISRLVKGQLCLHQGFEGRVQVGYAEVNEFGDFGDEGCVDCVVNFFGLVCFGLGL
jgi:hypothetical protein